MGKGRRPRGRKRAPKKKSPAPELPYNEPVAPPAEVQSAVAGEVPPKVVAVVPAWYESQLFWGCFSVLIGLDLFATDRTLSIVIPAVTTAWIFGAIALWVAFRHLNSVLVKITATVTCSTLLLAAHLVPVMVQARFMGFGVADLKVSPPKPPAAPTAIDKTQPGVNIPTPKPARLQFTFFTLDKPVIPMRKVTVPLVDDSVTIDFTVSNISSVPAMKPEIWIKICDGCKYTKEPEGFRKLDGAYEGDRYRGFDVLNPGIFIHKMSAVITPPQNTNAFKVGFLYACQTCGEVRKWQIFDVVLAKPKG